MGKKKAASLALSEMFPSFFGVSNLKLKKQVRVAVQWLLLYELIQ